MMDFGNQCGDIALDIMLESKGNVLTEIATDLSVCPSHPRVHV